MRLQLPPCASSPLSQQRGTNLRLLTCSRGSRPCGPALAARAQKVEEAERQRGKQKSTSGNGAKCKEEEDVYPHYEDEKDDTDFLPKREPGTFPNVRATGLQAALARLQGLAAAPSASTASASETEYDPLRDGPLRYLGYANECGEAFAAWLPFWGVPFSYAVAITYVLTDTADKGTKAFRNSHGELSANEKLHPEVNISRLVKLLAFERSLDTVIWQLLASVACPGYTIHTIVALAHSLLGPLEETAQMQQMATNFAAPLHLQTAEVLTLMDKSMPTMIGLAAIPFIVHPIDNFIHAVMNMSLRPAMRKYVCRSGQGELAGLQMCAEEECIPAEASAGESTNSGGSS